MTLSHTLRTAMTIQPIIIRGFDRRRAACGADEPALESRINFKILSVTVYVARRDPASAPRLHLQLTNCYKLFLSYRKMRAYWAIPRQGCCDAASMLRATWRRSGPGVGWRLAARGWRAASSASRAQGLAADAWPSGMAMGQGARECGVRG